MPQRTIHKLIPLFLALAVLALPTLTSAANRGEGDFGSAARVGSWDDRSRGGNDRDDLRYLEQREYERRYRDGEDNNSRRELRDNEEDYRERDNERERLRERFPEDRQDRREYDDRGDRDDRENPYREQNRYETREGRGYDDDEMSPAAREREWRRKVEQEQRELGRGSEQGRTQHEEHRRKWWNFWD